MDKVIITNSCNLKGPAGCVCHLGGGVGCGREDLQSSFYLQFLDFVSLEKTHPLVSTYGSKHKVSDLKLI